MPLIRLVPLACLLSVVLVALPARAATDFSFTGAFAADDDVQLFGFSVGAPSTVTLKTYSYAGGTNAAGSVFSAGGFDPILAVFDSTGAFIADNDDGSPPDVGIDPFTGSAYDTFLETTLSAGNYTVAVTQYDNFFNGGLGDNISLGFLHEGNPNFTFDFGYGPYAMFNDVDGTERTANWAFDILNVESATQDVPEPTTLAIWGLFGACGAAVAARRRRRGWTEGKRQAISSVVGRGRA